LGTGIMPRKLLRLTEAPILFVPETAPRQISSLLVAIDFSASSLEALKYGLYLKERLEAPLHCQHVYHIPMRYFPYIPVDNVSESMRRSAEKNYKRFLQSLKPKPAFDIPCTFT
ncbi:universal stress protein, partial [Arthrospira platensis SPKY1]|nr:universal stress protein [Arthrospira platensis SPKY1]